MNIFYSILAAVIPMLIYLIYIWRLDRNEPEEFKHILKHFFWGSFGAIVLTFVLSYLFETALVNTFTIFTNQTILSAVIVAPIVEEFTKGVYLLKTFRKNYFDNLTDGLVYGAAIGLGFGMTENLLYFSTYNSTFAEWISIVIIRSIFSAVMHAIATSTFGAFIAKAKFSKSKLNFLFPFIGLALAISFHMLWNLSLMFTNTYYFGLLFMIFLITSYLLVFNLSLVRERRIIRDELADEFYIPDEHRTIFSSSTRVNKKLMLKDFHKDYVRFATLLAFRKFQSKNSIGEDQLKYLADVDNYRMQLKAILSDDTIN